MFEELLPAVELPIPFDAFERLPRHPAYRYEYFGGRAVLTPRPHYAQAQLDLTSRHHLEELGAFTRVQVAIRGLESGDWSPLAPVFAAAFGDLPPFTVTDSDLRCRAAEACLEHTRAGRDGELVGDACFVASGTDGRQGLAGAVLVTLMRRDRLFRNVETPTPRGVGADTIPHLTWIFVSPLAQRRGAATALLSAVVQALRAEGHDRLASTMLVGNCRSILWHWRCGFRPLGVL